MEFKADPILGIAVTVFLTAVSARRIYVFQGRFGRVAYLLLQNVFRLRGPDFPPFRPSAPLPLRFLSSFRGFFSAFSRASIAAESLGT
jgi:hypothetical protein